MVLKVTPFNSPNLTWQNVPCLHILLKRYRSYEQAFVGRDATTLLKNIRRISTFRAKAVHLETPDEGLATMFDKRYKVILSGQIFFQH
jgi:hypothetical protein